MSKVFDATLLDNELKAAGLHILGCASTGRIDWKKPPNAAELKKAEAVLKAHDPKALPIGEVKLEELRAKRRAGKPLSAREQQHLLDLLLGI